MNNINHPLHVISKGELHSAIAREIAHLERAETIQGFSLWAVLGALSFILWQALDIYSKVNLKISLHLFFSIFFLVLCFRQIWNLIASSNKFSINSSKKYFTIPSSARLNVAMGSAFILGLLAVSCYLVSFDLQWKKWVPVLFLSIASIFSILYVPLISLIPTPTSNPQVKNDRGFWVFFILMQSIITFSAFVFLSSIFDSRNNININDLKFALLTVAALLLIFWELSTLKSREISKHLRRLDFDLAVGKVGVENGLNRFEALMLGSSMSDVLKPWIEEISFHADDARNYFQDCARLLNIAKATLDGDYLNKVDLVNSLMDKVVEMQYQAGVSYDKGSRAMNLFVLKFTFFVKISDAKQSEISLVIENIKKIWSDVKEENLILTEAYSSFKATYMQWKVLNNS